MAWAARPPHETTSTLPPRAAPWPAGGRAPRVGLRPDAFFSLFYRYRNRRPDRGQGWGVKGRGCPASARSPPLPPALIPSISKVFVLHGERGDPSLWSTAGQLLLIICAGQTHSQRRTLSTKPCSSFPSDVSGTHSRGRAASGPTDGVRESGRSVTGAQGHSRATWANVGPQLLLGASASLLGSLCWDPPGTESPLSSPASPHEGPSPWPGRVLPCRQSRGGSG